MLDCATDYRYILNATTLVFGYFAEEYEELWSECMAFFGMLTLITNVFGVAGLWGDGKRHQKQLRD